MANETKNVKMSIEDRVRDVIEGGGVAVHYDGTTFDSDALTEWVEPRIIGVVTTPSRAGMRKEGWLLNVNCYVRRDDMAAEPTTHRVWELVDLVLSAFDQLDLAIVDWLDTQKPTLFYARFNEGSVNHIPQPVSPRGSKLLQQLNVSFEGMLVA